MKRRVNPVATVLSLLLAVSAPAQTIGVYTAPRLSGGAPALVPFSPALGGSPIGPSLLSAPSLTPLLAAPSFTPALAPIKPAAVVPAMQGASALNASLSAASQKGHDQAPALGAAFDGLKAAAKDGDAVVVPGAPLTPEQFALRAQELLAEAKLAEAERLARGSSDIEGAIPSDDDMQGRMERLPSTNPERMKYIVDLFKLGGATDADIRFQDAGKGRNNVIVTKKGKSDRVIVVGGHYDKVSEGLGKIDNGTGSTMVANLYQALHGVDTDATIVFIAFAREEEGLYGSQAYVRSLDKAARGKIDAMINLDTLAVDGTFSWKNNSTRALLDRVAQVGAASGHAVKEDYLNGGDADSSTFRDAGVPAVTIYGASQDVIFDIIHSERDNMSAFNLAHYKNAYLLVHELIKSLDKTPLGPVAKRDI